MADTVLTLQFVNNSSQNLILDQRMWQTHPGFSEMTQEPANELLAYVGDQGLQYTQTRLGPLVGGGSRDVLHLE